MFGLSPLGLFFMLILALIMIGPRMLPAAVESLWLAITNLQRQQRNEEQLTLEQARLVWQANRSVVHQLVGVLNAVVEHLEEMRGRIVKVLFALTLGTALCFAFYNQIYTLLLKPIAGLKVPPMPGQVETTDTVLTLNQPVTAQGVVVLPGAPGTPALTTTVQITLTQGMTLPVTMPTQQEYVRPVFLKPTEMFMTTFKVAILGGVALSLPVIIYQVIAFIWPALIYQNEKRWVFIVAPSASLFFISGVLFAYFFMLPFALRYLLTFGGGIAVALPSIGEYIGFTTNLMFWIGVVFETPLVVFFLAKLKVVNFQQLKSMWKVAFLIAFVIGALITPTPDPINQAMVSLPIFLLYLLGLLFARFA
jgi:sec-independent protein translocase protein TatC